MAKKLISIATLFVLMAVSVFSAFAVEDETKNALVYGDVNIDGIITVVDATPSYVIPNGNGYLLVSSKGRILEEISENKDKLPELTCGDIKTKEVGQYVSFSDANVPDILEDVSQSLINNKVKNITGFDVTDTANIKLVYDGRIDINIGLPDDIDYKIRTAMTIITGNVVPKGVS